MHLTTPQSVKSTKKSIMSKPENWTYIINEKAVPRSSLTGYHCGNYIGRTLFYIDARIEE